MIGDCTGKPIDEIANCLSDTIDKADHPAGRAQ